MGEKREYIEEQFEAEIFDIALMEQARKDRTVYTHLVDSNYDDVEVRTLTIKGIQRLVELSNELTELREEHFQKIRNGDLDTCYTYFTIALSKFISWNHMNELGFLSMAILKLYKDNEERIETDFGEDIYSKKMVKDVLNTMSKLKIAVRSWFLHPSVTDSFVDEGLIPAKLRADMFKEQDYFDVIEILKSYFPGIPELYLGDSIVNHYSGIPLTDLSMESQRVSTIGDWDGLVEVIDFNNAELDEYVIREFRYGMELASTCLK